MVKPAATHFQSSTVMSSGPTVFSPFILFSDLLTSPLLNFHSCPLITLITIYSISILNPSNLLHILPICVDLCMNHSFPPNCPTMCTSQSILCVPLLLLIFFPLYTLALLISITFYFLSTILPCSPNALPPGIWKHLLTTQMLS